MRRLEEMADEVARYTTDHMRRERLVALETLRARMLDHDGTDPVVLDEVTMNKIKAQWLSQTNSKEEKERILKYLPMLVGASFWRSR